MTTTFSTFSPSNIQFKALVILMALRRKYIGLPIVEFYSEYRIIDTWVRKGNEHRSRLQTFHGSKVSDNYWKIN